MAGKLRFTRRDILIAGTSAAAWIQLPAWLSDVSSNLQAAEPNGKAKLIADSSKSLFRVHVEMDLEGNINLPANALVSKAKQKQLPVKAKSKLDWEERLLAFGTDQTVQAAERYYYEAKSEGTIGKTERKVELSSESRLVNVRRLDPKWVTFSPNGYLSGEELELLELPACSLAVDALLPAAEVQVGDTYQPQREALAKLLSLAAANDSDVVAEVVSLDAAMAKIHLKGKVQGSIGGVPTSMDLVGKMLFDREQLAVTWLAIALHEQRDIGKLEPGFDIAATIKMIRKPLDAPIKLSPQPSMPLNDTIPPDRLYTEISSPAVGFTALLDRRWKLMTSVRGSAMLRMVEDDRSIAQCDLRPAGDLAAGVQLTLAAFIADVKQSLDKRFGQLLESREEVNEFGLRVLRVTAQGTVEGVPIQWVFMHFSDDAGRRLLATMTVATAELDPFAGSEVQLAASLRFIKTEDELMETEVATVDNDSKRK